MSTFQAPGNIRLGLRRPEKTHVKKAHSLTPPHPTSGSGAGGWSLTDSIEDVGHLVVLFGRGFHEQQPLALCKLLPFLEEVTVESPH